MTPDTNPRLPDEAVADSPVDSGYLLARFDRIDPVNCPCGQARRAFTEPGNNVATMHVVDISSTSRTHYHKRMTELYFVLEGTGVMELDQEWIRLEPMTAILIRPGCRHRAIPAGDRPLRILNVPVPAFDPEDEWFD
ncbi:MAG: cupin domain-containing protein [Planctomycetaceae bacterium]